MVMITKWRDLSKFSIPIADIARIGSEISELHIRNFRMSVRKFGIRHRFFVIPRREYGELELEFDHSHEENCHTITMRANIYLGKDRIEAVIQGIAEYEYAGYDINIQDYLYTFLGNIIDANQCLKKYGPLSLPSRLSNYYPGCEWNPYVKTGYHREHSTQPLTVQAMYGRKTIPEILLSRKETE